MHASDSFCGNSRVLVVFSSSNFTCTYFPSSFYFSDFSSSSTALYCLRWFFFARFFKCISRLIHCYFSVCQKWCTIHSDAFNAFNACNLKSHSWHNLVRRHSILQNHKYAKKTYKTQKHVIGKFQFKTSVNLYTNYKCIMRFKFRASRGNHMTHSRGLWYSCCCSALHFNSAIECQTSQSV